MALTKTFPTQDPVGLSITDTRRVMSGLVARNADGTPRPGVIPANSNPLVTGRSTAPLMAYDVAPFIAALSRINNGVELVANDATTTVATTAAPASNSRIDVIWVRSRFQQHADGSNLPELGVTQGVAAAVPTKPAIPAGALELATAEILSTTTTTATAVITQTHPYTAPAGGVVRLRNANEQNAWSPLEGTLAYRLDTDQLIVYMPDAVTPGWHLVGGKPTVGSITFTGIYSASPSFPPRLVTAAGRVSLEGTVVSTAASFASGTAYTFGSIPAALAPTEDRAFAVTANGLFAILTITSAGLMTFTFPVAPGGVVGLSLSVSCPAWRLKGL